MSQKTNFLLISLLPFPPAPTPHSPAHLAKDPAIGKPTEQPPIHAAGIADQPRQLHPLTAISADSIPDRSCFDLACWKTAILLDSHFPRAQVGFALPGHEHYIIEAPRHLGDMANSLTRDLSAAIVKP
jgi:hypothetical protein